MKKRLKTEELIETEGPMNAVALDDAAAYLGFSDLTELTIEQARQLRAKKRKIVTASKKMERKVSKLLTRHADRLD
jgi:hypothetical protein